MSFSSRNVLTILLHGGGGPPIWGQGWGLGGGRGRARSDRQSSHYGRTNHTSDKCWDKFGPPTWANQVFPSSNGGIDVPTPVQPTSGSSESITLSLDDYNKLVQQSSKISLQSNITAPTATLAHSDTHALLNYGCSSSLWVIDSRTSYHMTRESSQFSHLTKSSNTSSILLADGFSSFVLGQGLIHLIPSSPF